ncbi:ubiquinone biosynthesis protein UbiJ [Marinicellulosiphila megalodicopiae]
MYLVILNQFSKAFDIAVEQVPECHKSLEELTNKIVEIHIQELPTRFIVKFHHHSIEFLEKSEQLNIDVSIHADAKSFLQLARAEDKQQVMMTSHFNISGNTQTLMALQKFMTVFYIDFEAILAKKLGDESAVVINNIAKTCLDFINEQSKSAKDTVANYIQNESGLTVAPYELDAFAQEVRTIQMRVERLQAKFHLRANQQGSVK